MTGFTADQIVQRIANANGAAPEVMRKRIEQVIERVGADTENLAYDERIIALEHELYDGLMPGFPGWEWDGDGYRNIRLTGEKL